MNETDFLKMIKKLENIDLIIFINMATLELAHRIKQECASMEKQNE